MNKKPENLCMLYSYIFYIASKIADYDSSESTIAMSGIEHLEILFYDLTTNEATNKCMQLFCLRTPTQVVMASLSGFHSVIGERY